MTRPRPFGALALILAAGCTPGAAPPPAAHAPAPPVTSPAAAPLDARAKPLGPEASPITFERMARYPEPGWQIPRAAAFAPDGKTVTFLASEDASDTMALFSFDLASAKSTVLLRARDVLASDKPMSREEELRRERQRKRIEGVTSYRWAKKADVMVVPLGGDVFVRKADGAVVRLTETDEPEIDPEVCPSGEKVAFARGRELFVIDVATKKETALTKGAPEGVTRGQSDFNGQEEFGEESGFFWSPGCDRVAYLEVDERAVPTVPVLGYRNGAPDLMLQRYPAAGQKNPSVHVKVVDVASKKTTSIEIDRAAGGADAYLGRFTFAPDGKALYLEALTRDQKQLSLLRADVATGKTKTVVRESSPAWIEMADYALLERSPRLVWTTAKSGHLHLELRDAASGDAIAALTSGDWDALSIAGLDEEGGAVLTVGTKDAALDRQLYRVPLAGGAVTRLTPEGGVHAVTLDRRGQAFVDVHSAVDRPPAAVVRRADGSVAGALPRALDADFDALRIRAPQFVTVKSAAGDVLHGALLTPRTMTPGKKYPAVVMVYGGPGVQTILNQWSPRLLWQHLADRGFVVFQLDNRGSSGRGPAFAAPIRGHLGDVELADQLAGADYLASLPYVDEDRMGIYGHSYGGFMATLAMLKAPGRFAVGIAGSPVIDWASYDTGYTERYMGTPADNAGGYAASDLAKLAGKLQGKLFVLHALMDENVHFINTASLIDALVAADKDFDLMVYPGERHGYRSPAAKRYALRRVVDYLAEHL
jgi:dipeptidyl-peptidase-4